MDGGTLGASGASIFLTLLALFYCGPVTWQKKEGVSDRTWIENIQSEESQISLIFSFLGFLFAFVWVWLAGFHWTTAIAFVWPYAAGYAWGRVMPRAYLKLPQASVIQRAVLVSILAFGALYVVITTSRPFSSTLNSVLIAFNTGTTHWIINGYFLLGASGFILASALFVTKIIGTRRDIRDATLPPPVSDEVLRDQILQRMDRGEMVSAKDFPNVDWVRAQNVMAALAQSLTSAALDYNPTEMTLAYQNATGISRLYNACRNIEMIGTDVTDKQRMNAARELVQVLVQGIGLPGKEFNFQLYYADFAVATVNAGELYPLLPAKFPVFVPIFDKEQLSESSNQIQATFQELFNAEHPQRGFGLVLSANDLPLLHDLLILSDVEGAEIVYLDQKEMRRILTSGTPGPRETFKNFVTERVSLASVIPALSVTEGSAKAVTFVGRGQEMSTILQHIDSHSYAILGARRIGKTSLMQRVEALLRDRGYSVLHLECGAVPDYQTFYQKIQEEWQEALVSYIHHDDLPRAFPEIVRAIRTSYSLNTPLVFCFDEIDLLLDFDVQQAYSELLFRTFRSLAFEEKCQFIFCGERLIYERLRNPSSPMFNFPTAVKLGLLSQDAARQLVKQTFELLNIPLDEGEMLIDRIVDACSRHPNLLQIMCTRILAKLNVDKTLPRQVTGEIVDQIIEHPDFSNDYIALFKSRSTPLEKAITLLAGPGPSIQPKDILLQLRQHGCKISQDQFTSALDFLILCGVFLHEHDGLKWAATHFNEFLSRMSEDRQEELAMLLKELQCF